MAYVLVDGMRITIVDTKALQVVEVLDIPRSNSTVLNYWRDTLALYLHSDYRWHITQSNHMPRNAQHDQTGILANPHSIANRNKEYE